MAKENMEQKELPKLEYLGRAIVEWVQFKQALPLGGGISYLSRTTHKDVEEITMDYTRREIFVRHAKIGHFRVPAENVLVYAARSFKKHGG